MFMPEYITLLAITLWLSYPLIMTIGLLIKFLEDKRTIKEKILSNPVCILYTFISGIIFLAFIAYGAQLGLYVDENGTSPSDAETLLSWFILPLWAVVFAILASSNYNAE